MMTPGRLLFEQHVPAEFRGHVESNRPLDSHSVEKVLQAVAENAPDQYRDISHHLLRLGANGSAETDSSFGLDDLRSPFSKDETLRQVQQQEAQIFARKDLTPEQKDREFVKVYAKLSSDFPAKIFDAAHRGGSNLAKMVASGARGNKG